MYAVKSLKEALFFVALIVAAGALPATTALAQSAGSCGQAYSGAIGDGTLCRVRVSPETCQSLGGYNYEQGICYFRNQRINNNSGGGGGGGGGNYGGSGALGAGAAAIGALRDLLNNGNNNQHNDNIEQSNQLVLQGDQATRNAILSFIVYRYQESIDRHRVALQLYQAAGRQDLVNRTLNDINRTQDLLDSADKVRREQEQQKAQQQEGNRMWQQAQEVVRQRRAEEERLAQEEDARLRQARVDARVRQARVDPSAGAGSPSPNAIPSGATTQGDNPFGNRRAASAGAAACVQRLRQQRLVMQENAELCGVSAELLQSMRNEQPIQVDCFGNAIVLDQRGSQLACARVYVCAANALTVAMAQAQAGVECTVAQQAGLARWPVPTQVTDATPRAAPSAPLPPLRNRVVPSPANQSGISVSRPGGSGRTSGAGSAQ